MNTIQINNIEYPVKFGLNALRIYCSARKIDFDQFQKELPDMVNGAMSFDTIEKLALLIQSAVKDGIRKDKTKMEVPSIDDVIDLFEDPEEFTKAMELFSVSMPEGEKDPEVKDTEEKN
jgi:hypothetical protein